MDRTDVVNIKQEMYAASVRLSKASEQLFKLAEQAAKTERDYRIALAGELLRLRTEGLQMALINDVARGNLADLKYERDLAEELYKAGRDSAKAIQVQLSALQSILRTQEEV